MTKYHDVPIFIICRDRLTPLQQLVQWLENAGYTNIILVDNASTYPPLVAYLDTVPHETIRLSENVGHLAVWQRNLHTLFSSKTLPGFYVVTDCDVVPDDSCPHNVIEKFHDLLVEPGAHSIDKVGFSLRIDDLPDSYRFKQEVIDWESQSWSKEIKPGVYEANIDTTFALYKPDRAHSCSRGALRTGTPYIARHMPWYLDSFQLNEEEEYYRAHMAANVNSWNGTTLPGSLVHAIDNLRRLRESKRKQDMNPEDKTNESRFTPPRPDCPHPEWWHSDDGDSTEHEVTALVAGFIRALQPNLVVETGTAWGQTAQAIGEALQINGHGRLISLEVDPARVEYSKKRCAHLPVDILLQSSLEFVPSESIGFIWFDSLIGLRANEFRHLQKFLVPGAIVGFHDTGPQHQLRPSIEALKHEGLDVLFLLTPRGVAFGQLR